jgi:HAD superfamily hydrolase (TIGR01509 family)
MQRPMITTLLLDLGNVLIFHDNALLVRNMATAAGRSVDDVLRTFNAELHDGLNRGVIGERGTYHYLRDIVGVSATDDALAALWSSHFTVHQAVMPMIESLIGRVKLVLVSNTNTVHVRYCKQTLPILARFDALVLSNEVGVAKPDRRIFEIALERAGATASQAAFFDDVQSYVDAAAALGIAGRVFTTAQQFRADLSALGIAV